MGIVKPLTNDPSILKSKLRQKKFAQEYIKHFDGTKAARDIGYSKKTASAQASRLLKNVNVQKEIKRLLEKQSDKNDVKISEIINELKLLGFSDIKDYIDVDSDTGMVRVKGLDDMPPGGSRAIESIKEKRSFTEDEKGDRSVIYSTFEFKLWSKIKALELLGRYKAMFTDKVDLKTNMPFNLIVSGDIKPDKKHNKNDNGKNDSQQTE